MKILHFVAAALLFVGIGVSTEASAQRYDGYSQYRGDNRIDRRDDRRFDRRYDRHDRRYNRRDARRWNRYDNHRGYGWRNNRRGDCRIVYRNHRRYTVCR